MKSIRHGKAGKIGSALLLVTLAGAATGADPVSEWNDTARQVFLAEKANALVQSRAMAIMHAALFDTVNAFDKRYRPYRPTPEPGPGASPEAAAVAAAYRVLVTLYPDQQPMLTQRYQATLDELDAGNNTGLAFGDRVAGDMLAWRAGDGADASVGYTPGSGPGVWAPTSDQPALGVHWGQMTPWLLQRSDQFRPEPPPALDSAVYRSDYEEVNTLGARDSTRRSAEQTDGAHFWIQSGVAGWNPIAIRLAEHKGLDLVDRARLLALLGLATADALIACYEAKYHYNFWRPLTAIRYDARAGSEQQRWEPGIPTPPFPAYPSGHACFGGAAAAILTAEFGDGEQPELTLSSATAPGVVRRYRRLQEILDDVSNARIWGGIHWRFDQSVGEALGHRVGEYTLTTALLPAGS